MEKKNVNGHGCSASNGSIVDENYNKKFKWPLKYSKLHLMNDCNLRVSCNLKCTEQTSSWQWICRANEMANLFKGKACYRQEGETNRAYSISIRLFGCHLREYSYLVGFLLRNSSTDQSHSVSQHLWISKKLFAISFWPEMWRSSTSTKQKRWNQSGSNKNVECYCDWDFRMCRVQNCSINSCPYDIHRFI